MNDNDETRYDEDGDGIPNDVDPVDSDGREGEDGIPDETPAEPIVDINENPPAVESPEVMQVTQVNTLRDDNPHREAQEVIGTDQPLASNIDARFATQMTEIQYCKTEIAWLKAELAGLLTKLNFIEDDVANVVAPHTLGFTDTLNRLV